MSTEIKVGTIFVNVWGYDQTNRDYYEVVKMTTKTVTIMEVASEMVPGDKDPTRMAGYTIPKPGEYTGPASRKAIKANGYDGAPTLAAKYGSFSLWDGKPGYVSWYA